MNKKILFFGLVSVHFTSFFSLGAATGATRRGVLKPQSRVVVGAAGGLPVAAAAAASAAGRSSVPPNQVGFALMPLRGASVPPGAFVFAGDDRPLPAGTDFWKDVSEVGLPAPDGQYSGLVPDARLGYDPREEYLKVSARVRPFVGRDPFVAVPRYIAPKPHRVEYVRVDPTEKTDFNWQERPVFSAEGIPFGERIIRRPLPGSAPMSWGQASADAAQAAHERGKAQRKCVDDEAEDVPDDDPAYSRGAGFVVLDMEPAPAAGANLGSSVIRGAPLGSRHSMARLAASPGRRGTAVVPGDGFAVASGAGRAAVDGEGWFSDDDVLDGLGAAPVFGYGEMGLARGLTVVGDDAAAGRPAAAAASSGSWLPLLPAAGRAAAEIEASSEEPMDGERLPALEASRGIPVEAFVQLASQQAPASAARAGVPVDELLRLASGRAAAEDAGQSDAGDEPEDPEVAYYLSSRWPAPAAAAYGSALTSPEWRWADSAWRGADEEQTAVKRPWR